MLQVNKEPVRQSLLALIDALTEPFMSNASAILEGLKECEDIKFLPDMILDCKQAPQHLGMVIGRLVKNSVFTLDTVKDFVESITASSLLEAEDMGTPEDMIRSVFQDLLNTVKSSV
jgi:hypothetical protein